MSHIISNAKDKMYLDCQNTDYWVETHRDTSHTCTIHPQRGTRAHNPRGVTPWGNVLLFHYAHMMNPI